MSNPVLQVGQMVTVNAPFDVTFPGTYPVLALAAAADTYTVDVRGDGVGSDFYIDHLEAA